MEISRNDRPFDENTPEIKGCEKRQSTVTKSALITAVSVTISACALLCALSVLISCLVYVGSLKKLYPSPVNQNDFHIEYSFDDETFIAVADQNARFVVEIIVGDTYPYERGSAIIMRIEPNCVYLLTNYHVIASHVGAKQSPIRLKLFGSAGFSSFGSLSCIGYDQYNDVAALKFNYTLGENYKDANGQYLSVSLPSYVSVVDTGVPTWRYSVDVSYEFEQPEANAAAQEDILYMGKKVLALGNALGSGMSACDGIISMPINDIVTATGNEYSNTVVQTTAPINSGNSGGGLFDMKGQLVALNTYKSRTYASGGSTQFVDNVSYSVPIELALSSFYRLINYHLSSGNRLEQLNQSGSYYTMSLYNLGLSIVVSNEIDGAQENGVVVLDYVSGAKLRTDFVNSDMVVDSPVGAFDSSGQEIREQGRYTHTISRVGGISFEQSSYRRRLSLTELKLLLLKLECELYRYAVSSTSTGIEGHGAALELVQNTPQGKKTFTATAVRLV